MNILIPLTDLKALAARASAVTPDKPTAPVLGCVIVAASFDGIDVTASDAGITYKGRTPCNVVQPGTIAVPARDLLAAAKNLPDGAVRLSVPKEGKVLLESGRSKTTLPTHDPKDYPMPAEVVASRTVTLPCADLARVIDDVVLSIAPDDNKYGMNVAKVERNGKAIRLVATDGLGRLAYSETEAAGDDPGKRANIPRRGLTELRKLLDGGGDVTLAFGDRAIIATVGTSVLHMRLAEVDFPDYRQVLPTQFKRKIMLDRAEFLTALRRVAYLHSEVKVDIAADGTVTLTTKALDRGESVAEVTADLAGEPMTIGYVAPILIDALSSMGGDRALLELGDTLSPGRLTDPEYPTALWIVMPARLAGS